LEDERNEEENTVIPRSWTIIGYSNNPIDYERVNNLIVLVTPRVYLLNNFYPVGPVYQMDAFRGHAEVVRRKLNELGYNTYRTSVEMWERQAALTRIVVSEVVQGTLPIYVLFYPLLAYRMAEMTHNGTVIPGGQFIWWWNTQGNYDPNDRGRIANASSVTYHVCDILNSYDNIFGNGAFQGVFPVWAREHDFLETGICSINEQTTWRHKISVPGAVVSPLEGIIIQRGTFVRQLQGVGTVEARLQAFLSFQPNLPFDEIIIADSVPKYSESHVANARTQDDRIYPLFTYDATATLAPMPIARILSYNTEDAQLHLIPIMMPVTMARLSTGNGIGSGASVPITSKPETKKI
jgi:hypothetical protein